MLTTPPRPAPAPPSRRARPSPAAPPGFRFPAPHPYTANAKHASLDVPSDITRQQDERAVTPEQKLVREMGLEDDVEVPVHASPPRSKTSPPAPTVPLPPVPSSASPPPRPARDPFCDPFDARLETLNGTGAESHSEPLDAHPSYTVSGIASHRVERKTSDAPYRAHDSPMPFRSLSGARAHAAHSPAPSAKTVQVPPPLLQSSEHLARQISGRSRPSDEIIEEKHEKRYQAGPVAAISPQTGRGAPDGGSVSEASAAQRRKAVKKRAVIVLIALVAIGAIAVAVGVAVSRNRTKEQDGTVTVATTSAASTTASSSRGASSGVVQAQTDSTLAGVLATAPDGTSTSRRAASSSTTRVVNVDSTTGRFVTSSRATSPTRAATGTAREIGESTHPAGNASSAAGAQTARTTAVSTHNAADAVSRSTERKDVASARSTARDGSAAVVEQVQALDARAFGHHHRTVVHH